MISSQSALLSSLKTTRSRGPWLAGGFCCPSRSSLTMASSETLSASRRLIVLRPPGLCPTALYGLAASGSLFCSAYLSLRAIVPTPVDRMVARVCSFTIRFGLRPMRRGSASTSPLFRFCFRGWFFRSCNVRFMLRPEELLALLRQGLLLPSFHRYRSPGIGVGYYYPGKQTIPGTGLPPVRYAAL